MAAMNILVANIGSTSFKYRLYAFPGEELLARGGVERIGSADACSYVLLGGERVERVGRVADHGAAVDACLLQLTDPETGCLAGANDLGAIAFKAVHARKLSGVQIVDEAVLSAMDAFADVAPAHNPPYLRAMRELRAAHPRLPLVAAFETDFHQTIPDAYRHYAVPLEWAERYGIVRWGFHGASHRYIAGRAAELLGNEHSRIIACHLGGSSSLCAIAGGRSIGNSLGMSPQSGLPHNNRVGDFDPFALPVLLRETGRNLGELLDDLATKSGLAGLGGAGGDLRDIEKAAQTGDKRARLAIDVFVGAVRDYLGAYLVRLGGVELLAFTGGIGENAPFVRERVCQGLEAFGIELDPNRNRDAKGEYRIATDTSSCEIWTIPANEELVVARLAFARLDRK